MTAVDNSSLTAAASTYFRGVAEIFKVLSAINELKYIISVDLPMPKGKRKARDDEVDQTLKDEVLNLSPFNNLNYAVLKSGKLIQSSYKIENDDFKGLVLGSSFLLPSSFNLETIPPRKFFNLVDFKEGVKGGIITLRFFEVCNLTRTTCNVFL